MNLSIVVPVYNEEQSIAAFHERLMAVMQQSGISFEVIYVNDGSTDGSAAALAGLAARVLIHDANMGYGAAIKTGIMHSRGEAIAIIDCDGTYDPADIPVLYKELKDREMVVGRRPREKGLRRMIKGFLRAMASYAVSCPIPDLNSGLRVFTRELAEKLFNTLPNGFSLTSTITVAALFVPFRVKFVPIQYHQRVGRSKIKPVQEFTNFSMLIARTVILFSPLKFFLPAALLFGLVGVGFLVRDLLAADVAQASILLITNAFILLAIGLLAEAINHRR